MITRLSKLAASMPSRRRITDAARVFAFINFHAPA